MTNPEIDAIFSQLDRDRHLAGYRLEERASPYFKMFLPEVMEQCGMAIQEPIIPEFPYAKEKANNRSPKVDFFALSKDGKCAFLIEIKTDMGSVSDKQDKELECAAGRRIGSFLCDIRSMSQTSIKQNRQKYFHVLQALECLKLIEMPEQLRETMYNDNSRGVNDLIKRVKVKSGDLCPKIIYILPKPPEKAGGDVISFEQFAHEIKGHGEIANRFARSLLEWAETDAGYA